MSSEQPECFCSRCTLGNPGNPQRVSLATWKRHNRKRTRPLAGTSGGPAEVAEAGTLPLAVRAGPADGAGFVGDLAGGPALPAGAADDPEGALSAPETSDDGSSRSTGSSSSSSAASPNVDRDNAPAPAAPPQPIVQDVARCNEVLLPVVQFTENIDDLALYAWFVQHNIRKAAVKDLLRLKTCSAAYRTPAKIERFIDASVDVHQRQVDACINGCAAYTHTRAALTSCEYCGQRRFRASGQAAKQVTYWSLSGWLVNMISDPTLGPEMIATMARAREAAGHPVQDLRDWYDGSNFRDAVRAGYFNADTDIALSLSTDGFEAWRQMGFQGWPVIVTVLNLSPEIRSRNVCQILVTVTPGPKQPRDLESFLHPLAEELDLLARGIPGVRVYGSTESHTLRGLVLQVTTDMLAGDKLFNAVGHNGHQPNQFRAFHGVFAPGANHTYYPPKHPGTGEVLFSVDGCVVPRRTAESIRAAATAIEAGKTAGRSQAYLTGLAKTTGIKGHSLLFCPSPAQRLSYPNLAYLSEIGPAAAPYDTMHLLLLNVVPLLWKLFSGGLPIVGDASEDYVLPRQTVVLIGREMEHARKTVPLSQARSLRNIDIKSKSFKAVDWMYWLLSTGEVQLAERIPDLYYNLFMSLCRASRLLFRPRGLSMSELGDVEIDLKRFVGQYYASVYRGSSQRLPVCRSTVAAVLDIVPNLRSCGPAWVSWQFPAERKIGSLTALIGSRSNPYASLVNNVCSQYKAELISSFGQTYVPGQWARATGKEPRNDDLPSHSLRLSMEDGLGRALMPPRTRAAPLQGEELTCMRAVLLADGVNLMDEPIIAVKYFRLRFAGGGIAGARPIRAESERHCRRNFLVRVNSSERRRAANGQVQEVAVSTYGAVLHYAAVPVVGEPGHKVFAFMERIKSARDRSGRYGYAAQKWGRDCFYGFGGAKQYVPVGALDAAVGTLEREGLHAVLFDREPFSEEN